MVCTVLDVPSLLAQCLLTFSHLSKRVGTRPVSVLLDSWRAACIGNNAADGVWVEFFSGVVRWLPGYRRQLFVTLATPDTPVLGRGKVRGQCAQADTSQEVSVVHNMSYSCVYVCQSFLSKSRHQPARGLFPVPQSFTPQLSGVTCLLLFRAPHVVWTANMWWKKFFQVQMTQILLKFLNSSAVECYI